MIECIVENKRDAIHAEKLGVNRLELVSAIAVGGLTPSHGTIKTVLKSVHIPVQVMVRPHPYGFVYDTYDKEVMLEEIAFLNKLGHHRIVIGALRDNHKIDTDFLDQLFKKFPEVDVTFHRAFDEVDDQMEAYETLTRYSRNVKRILTSGGEDNCSAGIINLSKLVQLQRETKGPEILPGSGLDVDNITEIHEAVQAKEYHFGRGVRSNKSFEKGFNKKTVDEIKRILK
ncbi:copper homeostasis protein CutC [Oceanobacillus luteolus]|uniref:copper homeostasis protein CutC n=1 Tax=Oceanobacillus luteolus TaxID=1274358 RepID=UPI0020421442|nr:copper homeostasis protein CutC [Oceanobacillus luteolus]MCM3740585.1 copper homeostasis protein CutC [Oceanobacillus luteolus]